MAGTQAVRLLNAGAGDCVGLGLLLCNVKSELSCRPAKAEAFDGSSVEFLSAAKLDSFRPACSISPVFSTSLRRLIDDGACCKGGIIVKLAMQEQTHHPATPNMTSIIPNSMFLLGSLRGFVLGLVEI
jgi:hypothetical protein